MYRDSMRLICCVLLVSLAVVGQVKLTRMEDRVEVSVGKAPFTTFFFGGNAPKPFLHPLRTASGIQVTRGYPMDFREGEKKDHPHHRGLWFTHGDVNGWDFWMNEPGSRSVGKGAGRMEVTSVDKIQSGRNKGSLRYQGKWRAGDGGLLLNEERTMTFHADAKLRMVDLDVTLTAENDVIFGDTKEGVFAIRVARTLEEEMSGRMTAADGRAGEKAVWGTQSPWVDYAGTVDGEQVGIAIFDHPANPRHPTYWHSRAYGLFAANIFGKHDFLRDKTQDGSLALKRGEKLRFRYRVIIHAGDAKAANVAKHYEEFSRP
jgi:hypothetical protein